MRRSPISGDDSGRLARALRPTSGKKHYRNLTKLQKISRMHALASVGFVMKILSLVALCAAMLLSHHALGADDGTDPSLTVVKDLQVVVVQRDGSYVETSEKLVQLNEQRAVAESAQRQFHFNRTLEDVEILEAYTEKPDGRRIPVLPEQIKLQQEPAYSAAPMFQDMQIKTVIYADVAVGDKVYSKMRLSRRSAMFAGQFSDITYPLFRPTKQLTLIYDLPSEMTLKSDDIGFMASAPEQHDGRTVYRWDYMPADNPRVEADAVAYWDFGGHLIVSTFDNYADVGLAYDRAAAGAAAPSARIEAQARELVRGISDPRDQALAIDNWVRKNVRYVGVYIGNGGLVPHSAESVMDHRYGDCKDHATLMEAMLRVVGIDSTPVLINGGNSYKLSPVASLGQFNHAITYIPSLDLYLDSTAESIGAGYLPVWDLDKQVILTKSGTLGHTPASGDVELGDLSDQAASHGYGYTLRGKAENWVYLPGTIGVAASSSLYAGLAQQVFGLTNEATRTQPFVCPENDYEEAATYEFPKNAVLLAVPPDVHIASPYFQYHTRFKRIDGKLLIDRSFKSGKSGSKVCSPEDYLAMQADIKKMVRDLRSQFILKVSDLPAASVN